MRFQLWRHACSWFMVINLKLYSKFYFSIVGFKCSANLADNEEYKLLSSESPLTQDTASLYDISQIIPAISVDLKRAKSLISTDLYGVKLFIQSVSILSHTAHKSLAIYHKQPKSSDDVYNDALKRLIPPLVGSEEDDSEAGCLATPFNNIIKLIDEFAFVSPEGDTSSKLAYLESFGSLSLHHLGIELFGSLLHLVRIIRQEYASRTDKFWFISLFHVVKTRLQSTELDSYFTTQLPEYLSQVQVFLTAYNDRCNREESTLLLVWVSERCIKFLEEFTKQGGDLDRLLVESPRKDHAKDQLVSFYLGYHNLWYQSIYDGANSIDRNQYITPQFLEKDKLKSLINQVYLIKIFKTEQELAPQKKELYGFLFFLGLTFLFNLEGGSKNDDSKENEKTLTSLMEEYYNPQMVDFTFLYNMMRFCKEELDLSLVKTLNECKFVKEIQIRGLWFSETLFECDAGPSIAYGQRRYVAQYDNNWWIMPMIGQYFDVDPYFPQRNADEEDLSTEELSLTLKTRMTLEVLEVMKKRLDAFYDRAIDALRGERDPIEIGLEQRRLETQLTMLPDFFMAVRNYLRPEDKKELGLAMLNLFTKEYGLLECKERFHEILEEKNSIHVAYFDADKYFEVLNLTVDQQVLNAFVSPKDIKTLNRSQLENLGRLAYFADNFSVEKEEEVAESSVLQEQLKTIHTDDRFDAEKVILAMFTLISVGKFDKSGKIEFPEFSLTPVEKPEMRPLDSSLVGFLLYGLQREKDAPLTEIQERVALAFSGLMGKAIGELKNLNKESKPEEIMTGLEHAETWIKLVGIIGDCMGEPASNWEKDSALIGWAEIIQNGRFLEIFSELVQVLQGLISLVSPKKRDKKTEKKDEKKYAKLDKLREILTSIIKTTKKIKSKAFGGSFTSKLNEKAALKL